MDRLLTATELAEVLGLSPKTVSKRGPRPSSCQAREAAGGGKVM